MTALLAATEVVAGYPGRPPVLRGANLSIHRGRRVAILGANGSGKTTLLRVLSGAHRPSEGTVTLAGAALAYGRKDLREHRRHVQLVLQDPDDQLFCADVTQDVAFGPLGLGLSAEQARERVAEALALLGIAGLAGRATHQLSYGERKRVAIAGALAMRPDVLLLDEPTAGLDPVGTHDLLAALAGLEGAGTAVVLATHDVDLALDWADETAVVVGGSITSGLGVDLLGDERVVAAAGLRRPWPLELAARLGLPGRPRRLDEVVALLAASDRVGVQAQAAQAAQASNEVGSW